MENIYWLKRIKRRNAIQISQVIAKNSIFLYDFKSKLNLKGKIIENMNNYYGNK